MYWNKEIYKIFIHAFEEQTKINFFSSTQVLLLKKSIVRSEDHVMFGNQTEVLMRNFSHS